MNRHRSIWTGRAPLPEARPELWKCAIGGAIAVTFGWAVIYLWMMN